MAHSKVSLRSWARARRRMASTRDVAGRAATGLLDSAASAGLLRAPEQSELVGSVTVASYIASPGEPDVAAIGAAVRSAGGRVLLPVPVGGGQLRWAFDNERYVPHASLPISVPGGPVIGSGSAPLIELTAGVLLVPALAADQSGSRLGQGGGYYDRLLAGLADTGQRVFAVAVVYDEELLDTGEIPLEKHDQRVQAVLTPTRFVPIPP